MLGIDPRSLALFRVGLGAMVAWDLLMRSRDLQFFYSDSGALPRSALIRNSDGPGIISLHLMSGATPVQAALFALAGAAAVAMVIGYRTRAATCLAWFLTASLHRRNFLVLSGGDDYLRLLLFWSMFLPLGRAYSWEGGMRPAEPKKPILSMGTAALLLQTCLVYWVTAAQKWRGPEWHDGSAVLYALQIDLYALPPAKWLLLFPAAMQALTHVVLWFEILGPFLLISPWAGIRFAGIALFAAMHGCFYSTLFLETFPKVSVVALLAFVPGAFWDWHPVRTIAASLPSWLPARMTIVERAGQGGSPGKPRALLMLMSAIVAGLLLIAAYCGIARVRSDVPSHGRLAPLIRLMSIDQGWNLFAPSPMRTGGWLVAKAHRSDGREVDLFREGASYSSARPNNPIAIAGSERRRKMMMRILQRRDRALWQPYAAAICRDWNDNHPRVEQVRDVELIAFERDSATDGTVRSDRKTSLLRTPCPSEGRLQRPTRGRRR